MSENKTKPSRPTRAAPAKAKQGSIYGDVPSRDVTLQIKSPGNFEIDVFAKFAQLIMYGIATLAIWGGIFSIAFAENATNQNFLVLGVGGILSAGMALALVEMQRRKGGDGLHAVHDYLLGISFFFAAIGVLWGTRYLMGVFASQGFEWLLEDGIPYADTGWSPSANGIYVQLIACTALVLFEYSYIKQLKGSTSFGWAIITFTPLALLIAGVGAWLSWSGDVVSWELGIAIVGFGILSMWLALESNNSLIFSIVAVVAGLIPLIYEVLNENAPADGVGGALSLLVFIVIGQGVLAADERVRKDLMQLTSLFLVGEVLLAILITRAGDLNLILGPIRESGLGDAATYINLESVLWITLLLAYFPAVHKQRIPWMPIGLAGSIWILTPGASLVAWGVTLIALPYMFIFAKATRSWVANATFVAVALSFFIQDSANIWNDGDYIVDEFKIMIVIGLVAIGEFSRNYGVLKNWAHFLGIGVIILSDSILINGGVLISWLLVLYIIGSSWRMLYKASITNEIKDRLEGSAALFVSLLLTIILTINDRLTLPLPENVSGLFDGLDPSVGLLAILIWGSTLRFRKTELDIGHLIHWCIDSGQKNVPTFDMKDGTWTVHGVSEEDNKHWINMGWGTIGRISLIGPLMLLSISISYGLFEQTSGNEIFWVSLMVIPIGILLWEILDREGVSSLERALASWIMVLIALPISEELNWLQGKYEDYADLTGNMIDLPKLGEVFLSNIIFDLLLILGPLIITIILIKKGFNHENRENINYNADKFAYLGLLVLALLDTSGGLALLLLYGVVIFNAVKYRHFFVLAVAPFTFIIAEDNMMGSTDLIGSVLNSINLSSYDLAELTILGMPRFSCIIIAITAAAILIRSMLDKRNSTAEELRELPTVAAAIWLGIGIWGILPETAWVLFTITIGITLQNIFTGRLFFIPYAPAAILFSLLTAFTLDVNFVDLSGGELLSYSLLGMGVFSLILHYLARTGLIYRWAEKGNDVEKAKGMEAIFGIPDLDSIKGREQLITNLQYWTVAGLLLSWDVLFGIGTICGAIWITWEVKKNGQKDLVLLMPILHAFALWNFIEQIDDTRWETIQNIVVGIILIGEGGIMTYVSSKSEIAWNWDNFEFDDEKSYFDWLDRMGMMSIFYIITGIIWIMDTADLDSLMWGIISIYLCTVAIQGFQEETDSGWRRSIGGFGSILSIFILSTTIDDPLYRSITWLGLGIVAFGFGMLYMQRFGEEAEVFVEENAGQVWKAKAATPVLKEEIPEAVIEEIVEEEIPEAVAEIVEEESQEDLQPLLKKEIEEAIAEESIPEPVTEEVVEDDVPEAVTDENNLIETNEGFFFKLSPDILNNIKDALKNTDHEGYKPVLEFDSSGQIVLNFE